MSKVVKKSRKAIHNYIFDNENDCKVEIDLNNYVAICTVTGNEKRFYHSYLANMIEKKFDNNIDTFEQTYVSREGQSGQVNTRKVAQLEERISKLYTTIRELKAKRDTISAA